VIAAGSFRGGRLVRDDDAPGERPQDDVAVDAPQQLEIMLDGIGDESLIRVLCERNHISEADFHAWRETSLASAAQALYRNGTPNGQPNGVARV